MANQQHIEWLLEGVEAWNARREREDFVPDFEGADLPSKLVDIFSRKDVFDVPDLFSPQNLDGYNLSGAIFRDANCSGVSFVGADLKMCDFSNCNLDQVDFSDADVSSTPFLLEGFGLDDEGTALQVGLGHVDFRNAKNLSQDQLNSMNGDSETQIPEGLKRPDHWPQNGATNSKLTVIKGVMAAKVGAAPKQPEKLILRDRRGAVLRDSRGAAMLARRSGNSEKVGDDDTFKNARTKFADVTPIADVEWSATGHLKAELKPIQPQPRQPVPTPNPAAVIEQIRGVLALSKQLRQQIENSTSPNAAPFIGDAGKIFVALETQLEKGQSELIPVVVKANITALKAMGPGAEALAATEEALYTIFIEEADKLLNMLPVLKIIENPYNEDIVPDQNVAPALDALNDLDEKANTPEVIEQLGPRLGGVTREAEGFPWESDKQKIANKSSFWLEVGDKLRNPPDSVKGAAPYATVANAMLTLIKTLLSLIFP